MKMRHFFAMQLEMNAKEHIEGMRNDWMKSNILEPSLVFPNKLFFLTNF